MIRVRHIITDVKDPDSVLVSVPEKLLSGTYATMVLERGIRRKLIKPSSDKIPTNLLIYIPHDLEKGCHVGVKAEVIHAGDGAKRKGDRR